MVVRVPLDLLAERLGKGAHRQHRPAADDGRRQAQRVLLAIDRVAVAADLELDGPAAERRRGDLAGGALSPGLAAGTGSARLARIRRIGWRDRDASCGRATKRAGG
jgi:hypothetical protein